jgi:hypothetical protein
MIQWELERNDCCTTHTRRVDAMVGSEVDSGVVVVREGRGSFRATMLYLHPDA